MKERRKGEREGGRKERMEEGGKKEGKSNYEMHDSLKLRIKKGNIGDIIGSINFRNSKTAEEKKQAEEEKHPQNFFFFYYLHYLGDI